MQFEAMLKFTATKETDIINEVVFKGTMLRNGIMSLSDELKFATDYDNILNEASTDSLLDGVISSDSENGTRSSSSLSENLEEHVLEETNVKDNANTTQKNAELTHNDATCDYDFVNNTCQCFFKTSTPVRVKFDPYEEIFPVNVNTNKTRRRVVKLQTTEDNLEEIRTSDEALENILAVNESVVYQHVNCSPKVRKSLRKIGKSSKKGAITVFATVLTNIV